MSAQELKYCPYCRKMVPFHKAPRRGICCFFIIITSIAPVILIILSIFNIAVPLILFIIGPLLIVGIILLWRFYLKKVRPDTCNLCENRTLNQWYY